MQVRPTLHVYLCAVMLSVLILTSCATETPQADSASSNRSSGGSSVATASGDSAEGSASIGSWPRWGGPDGDFKIASSGLADSWPAEGPPVLWSRQLGDGYSAIAADGGILYTMYRDGKKDVVVALDAGNGSTHWERSYDGLTRDENQTQFGSGPNATPLVLDDRLITLGYGGELHCLERKSGEVLWSHDLIDGLGGDVLSFGYSASPILHDGRVIVLVGGEQAAVMAFSPEDGSIDWKSAPGSVSYATPIVIDVDGQEQLVYFSDDAILGIDASDGSSLWSFPVVNQYRNNATDPLWGKDGLLWVATQLDGGTRALRLSREGDATNVEEVWSSNKLSIHFWNALRLDDMVFASIGSNATILAGVDVASGEIRWRERGFEQANFVHAGDRTILLDAKGHLAIVRLARDGMEVLTQARVVEEKTWTPPSLVGTRLYLRDQKTIRALDLGTPAAQS